MITFYFIIFFSSLLMTKLFIHILINKNILDLPNKKNSLHVTPTPRGGGLAFVILFNIIFCLFSYEKKIPLHLFYALYSGNIIVFISLLDDFFTIKARWRLLIHIICATLVVYLCGPFLTIKNLFPSYLFVIPYFITILSIVWCINLYNFMDGVDGIASSEAIFIFTVAAVAFYQTHNLNMSFLCMALSSAIAGFLFWNWSPAKIFMGDCGSCYLGFTFSTIALYSDNQTHLPLFFWVIIILLFISDTTLTLVHRIIRKKPLSQAHNEHVYNALVRMGMSHADLVRGLLIFNIVFLIPNAFILLIFPHSLLLPLAYCLQCVIVWLFLSKLTRWVLSKDISNLS